MKKIFYTIFLLLMVTVVAQEHEFGTKTTKQLYDKQQSYLKKFKRMLPIISQKTKKQIAKFLVACGLGCYYGIFVNHHMKSGKNSFVTSLLCGVCEGTLRLTAFVTIIVIGVIAQEMAQSKGNIIIGLDLGTLLFP